ncbi:cobalamin adenosyltransferase [Crassaminicella indica]|uniref:Cobalamin adenosyltransferase n=1 Tax=Crassaminicella indica TaxID=2855394 RepID=A0ABX8RDM2_9CLOT|nr:cobalamin adenosyltransferase [Crassaminicella indica]QXM06519.1 cobalamin adenosyltransferase [Crassaminicella indica]
MSVLTEAKLRSRLRNQNIKTFKINKNDIITPAASTYLSDRNIKLVYEDEILKEKDKYDKEEDKKEFFPRFECISGGFIEKKPEHMTQIYGNKLVDKDHPRILFRGKIDSLEAKILYAQFVAFKEKKGDLLKDLEEIMDVVRRILRAEVMDEEIKEHSLLGMSLDEIREKSHNPKKYLGVDHIFYPSYKEGECFIVLNELRTVVRETEIAAINAFKDREGDIKRKDILRLLNRLSSCFYIMMLKLLAQKYK